MSDPIVSIPNASVPIGKGPADNPISTEDLWLTYFQDITDKLNSNLLGGIVQLTPINKADLPAANLFPYGMLYVLDDVGGSIQAVSDGTNWRRPDRVIIS